MFGKSGKTTETMREGARPCWIFNEIIASLDTYQRLDGSTSIDIIWGDSSAKCELSAAHTLHQAKECYLT